MRWRHYIPESVQSEDDVIRWLVTHTRVEEWIYSDGEDLPEVVVFASEMLWIKPSKLVEKVRKCWETALDFGPPRRRRMPRRDLGWR